MKLSQLHEGTHTAPELLMLLFTTLGQNKKPGKLLTTLETIDKEDRDAILLQAIELAKSPVGGSLLNELTVAVRALGSVRDVMERAESFIDNAPVNLTHPVIKQLSTIYAASKRMREQEDDLPVIGSVLSRLEMYRDGIKDGDLGDLLKLDETDVAFVEATLHQLGLLSSSIPKDKR